MKFDDGLYSGMDGRRLAEQLPNGTAPQNVSTFVCTAGGEVLHTVPGYWKPGEYGAELAFAQKLAGHTAEARARAHSARAAQLPAGDVRRPAHDVLAEKPERKLDEFLANTQAGLR